MKQSKLGDEVDAYFDNKPVKTRIVSESAVATCSIAPQDKMRTQLVDGIPCKVIPINMNNLTNGDHFKDAQRKLLEYYATLLDKTETKKFIGEVIEPMKMLDE